MRSALLVWLKRLETVRAVEESNRPFKIEFAYLNPAPSNWSSATSRSCRRITPERHIVSLGRLPDGKYQWEERPGLAPANED
jgi:hypothetical protein